MHHQFDAKLRERQSLRRRCGLQRGIGCLGVGGGSGHRRRDLSVPSLQKNSRRPVRSDLNSPIAAFCAIQTLISRKPASRSLQLSVDKIENRVVVHTAVLSLRRVAMWQFAATKFLPPCV